MQALHTKKVPRTCIHQVKPLGFSLFRIGEGNGRSVIDGLSIRRIFHGLVTTRCTWSQNEYHITARAFPPAASISAAAESRCTAILGFRLYF